MTNKHELEECERCGRLGCRNRQCKMMACCWITLTPSRSRTYKLCQTCDDILMTILDATITEFVANKKEN